MNIFWRAQQTIQLGVQSLQAPRKFGYMTNYRDILRPYAMGIRAYYKVNIKYFNHWLMLLLLKYGLISITNA